MSLSARVRVLPELVPEQEFLNGFVTTVVGPIDFRVWVKQLERMHEIFELSGIEKTFQRLSLAQRNEEERGRAEKKVVRSGH